MVFGSWGKFSPEAGHNGSACSVLEIISIRATNSWLLDSIGLLQPYNL